MIIRLPRQLLRPEIILQRRRRPLSNEARLARYLAFVLLVCLAAYVYLLPASRTVAVHAQIRQVSSDYETQLTANAETIIAISKYTNMTALTARARQTNDHVTSSTRNAQFFGNPQASTAAA